MVAILYRDTNKPDSNNSSGSGSHSSNKKNNQIKSD